MTMTDTEAKALALVNEIAAERGEITYGSLGRTGKNVAGNEALCRAIEREEATEARHAAELREQAERFSEVVTDWFGRYSAEVPPQFQPFILPAPDPVSEWLAECSDSRVSDHTMTMLRLFHNWLSEKETRKIGEEGEHIGHITPLNDRGH